MPPRSDDLFSFPLVTIDFEASALTLQSYPIEVGIAIAQTPASGIEVWSALIAPCSDWALTDQWDPDAEKIHGISSPELRKGMPATSVVETLNDLITSGTAVWCDGGHYDAHWLSHLEAAAKKSVLFSLVDVGSFIKPIPDRYTRFLEVMRQTKAPHRAGPDAARLCFALRVLAEPKNPTVDDGKA